MFKRHLVTSEAVVYREVDGELLLVELSSGGFHHLSIATREMLDYFRKPRKADDFIAQLQSNRIEFDENAIRELIKTLVKHKILIKSKRADVQATQASVFSGTPVYLRKGQHKLEEVNFFY